MQAFLAFFCDKLDKACGKNRAPDWAGVLIPPNRMKRRRFCSDDAK